MYKEILPSRLKEARKRTGFTQREIEKETKISHVSIARYETGAREPDVETLGRLAEFYGVTTDWLIGLARNTEQPEAKKQARYMSDMEKEIAKEERKERRKNA